MAKIYRVIQIKLNRFKKMSTRSLTYQQSIFSHYRSDKTFLRVFTYKMAAKINRHALALAQLGPRRTPAASVRPSDALQKDVGTLNRVLPFPVTRVTSMLALILHSMQLKLWLLQQCCEVTEIRVTGMHRPT